MLYFPIHSEDLSVSEQDVDGLICKWIKTPYSAVTLCYLTQRLCENNYEVFPRFILSESMYYCEVYIWSSFFLAYNF